MSETKKILPRLEFFIIAVFFLGFFFWAISRCNSTRAQMSDRELEERRADSLMQAANIAQVMEKARKDSLAAAHKAEESRIVRERVTPLYTTVDKVNVRREPKLNGAVVSRLELHEEVTFLNEVTDFQQEITIEGVKYNEPWVKVKTQAGRIGWVYGGTVSYYKR
ncbi:MAG: SH3 domain-containing protein [Saprospiraceae bacterium]